jgi:nucleoside-diphosphate-sugar epimerase
MNPILVTGANSLLGAHVINELIGQGYPVRGLVRENRTMPFADPLLEIRHGDFTSADTLSEALRGCSAVIHVAADTRQDRYGPKAYAAVNVKGTQTLIAMAEKYHLQRIILVGTANAFGYGTRDNPATEVHPFCIPFSRSGYAHSKWEAQQWALGRPAIAGRKLIIVNPTFLIGRFDAKPSSGRIILRGYKRRFVVIPPGGKNFIPAVDAAKAIVAALFRGRDHECYLLGGENLTYREFYRQLCEITGQQSRFLILPRPLLLLAGLIGTLLAHCGVPTALRYNNMRILCLRTYYDNKKAVEHLGLPRTPLKQAMSEAISWFKEAGMLT